jgi:hypothetical protein
MRSQTMIKIDDAVIFAPIPTPSIRSQFDGKTAGPGLEARVLREDDRHGPTASC